MSPNLSAAIVGHLVGDYLLQNDWLAAGKKRSHAICALHAGIWTTSTALLGGLLSPLLVSWLFVTHFAIDRWGFVRWWMAFVRQPVFLQPPMAPWSIIVVDNVWHLVTIFIAVRWA